MLLIAGAVLTAKADRAGGVVSSKDRRCSKGRSCSNSVELFGAFAVLLLSSVSRNFHGLSTRQDNTHLSYCGPTIIVREKLNR